MDNILRLVLYLTASLSLFMLMSLITLFSEEVSFKNLFLCITPVLISFLIYTLYLKEKTKTKTKTKAYEYQDGDVLNIFADMPWSVNGEEYSEGVFFWYKEGNFFTDLEFHIEKGGDPDVFLEWLEQEKRNPRYLKSVTS